MTQEQKAKRYEEALERANKIYTDKYKPEIAAFCKQSLENIFPELKESEDERVRKGLVAFVKSRLAGFPECDRFIAWLEKQDIFSKKDVDDAYLKGVSDTKNEIEKQYEANYQIRKDIATFLFNYNGDIKDRAKWMNYLGIKVSFVEKQGEQKPTEWSEEDDKHIDSLLKRLEGLCRNEFERTRFAISDDEDWLKSIKERIK